MIYAARAAATNLFYICLHKRHIIIIKNGEKLVFCILFMLIWHGAARMGISD